MSALTALAVSWNCCDAADEHVLSFMAAWLVPAIESRHMLELSLKINRADVDVALRNAMVHTCDGEPLQ